MLLITILQANAMSDKTIKNHMKKYVEKKMKASVKNIDIISAYEIPSAAGWHVHFLSITIKIKMGDSYQNAIVPQTVFTRGERITLKLMKKAKMKADGTMEKSENYSKLLKPKVPMEAYNDAHLIAGVKNAPHKILLFSDPFCPFCRKKFPEILDVVKKNPKTYGLYYYHFPLTRIHPAADLVTRAMHIFQKKRDLTNFVALYDLFLEASETDPKEILLSIQAKTRVVFTLDQLNSPEVERDVRFDKSMQRRLQVTGTPTIFIDGKWDRSRNDYKKYAK